MNWNLTITQMCNSNTRSEYFLASCIYSCTQDTYYHWLCLSLQFRIVTTKGVREIIKSQNSFFVLYSLFPSPVVIVVWYIPDVCMCALGWGERKRKPSFGWNYYNQKVWREKWLFMLLCSPESFKVGEQICEKCISGALACPLPRDFKQAGLWI